LANPGIDHKQAGGHLRLTGTVLGSDSPGKTQKEARQERLAAALRENMRRRRAQARKRAEQDGDAGKSEQVSAEKPPQSPTTSE